MGWRSLTDPPGATPLDPDEAAGLRLSWVATRGDLNAAEAQNITGAVTWVASRRLTTDQVLRDGFLRELHQRMFGEVWNWAGIYRQTEKNIGVDPRDISVRVRSLVDDVPFWIADPTPSAWSTDEIGARFHHQLVFIHLFPNGNGRHGRLATDLLLLSLGVEPFSWGRGDLGDVGEVRARYISALRAADGAEFGPLLDFARS